MLAELVFVTRFLGLVSGEREVVLNATPEVRRVEVRRDGERLAAIAAPPWRATVDLGPELGPYELTAVGYGADGTEVARDTQILNLARPAAEAGMILGRDGPALTAQLQWSHIQGKAPTAAIVRLDGKVVSREVTSAPIDLGEVNDGGIHAVGVELQFADGVVARKELAFGGMYSEQLPAELTPVAVRQRQPGPPALTPCFRIGARTLAPVAVERAPAIVSFVVNGAAGMWANDVSQVRNHLAFALHEAEMRVISPVLREGPGADFFPSESLPGIRGTRTVLLRDRRPRGPKLYAHAVAAAAMRLLRGEQRRAVVYVLGFGAARDDSEVPPAAVRRYLSRIGVPLRVWSLTGKRPDLIDSWGPVQDVSSARKLAAVTAELRTDLETQRIAWLPAAPLEAIRASATEDCAYVPLSRNQ